MSAGSPGSKCCAQAFLYAFDLLELVGNDLRREALAAVSLRECCFLGKQA